MFSSEGSLCIAVHCSTPSPNIFLPGRLHFPSRLQRYILFLNLDVSVRKKQNSRTPNAQPTLRPQPPARPLLLAAAAAWGQHREVHCVVVLQAALRQRCLIAQLFAPKLQLLLGGRHPCRRGSGGSSGGGRAKYVLLCLESRVARCSRLRGALGACMQPAAGSREVVYHILPQPVGTVPTVAKQYP